MAELAAPAGGFERVIGRRRGEAPGPTLIAVAGVHGNEPAGVHAARRVLLRLAEADLRVSGELVALCGNLRALRQNRRYLDRDLNRQWTAAGMARAAASPDGAEGEELVELRAALDEVVAAARGPVCFVDLHTTSAEGIPFALVGDTLAQRRFAAQFPLPAILGLEEQIDGVLAEYMASLGATSLSVEGGQHDSPDSARSLESVLVCAVAAAGLVDRVAMPGVAEAEAHLARLAAGLPRLTEIVGRHPVTAEDGFRMEPGYANIGRVRAGELLAHDRRGDIRARQDGVLLLPLYQALGDDGFFFGREIGDLEQRASGWARRLGIDRLLAALPGVRRGIGAAATESLDLRPGAARAYPQSVFRWFGYRRAERGSDGSVTLARRRNPKS